MSLLIVTAFCEKDYDLAIGMYRWIGELGGIKNNDVLLITDPDMPVLKANKVVVEARRVAKSVTRINTTLKHAKKWPDGANAAFMAAAGYVKQSKQAFLWLEADCVPVKSGWIEAIETEYAKCGKSYMGEILTITLADKTKKNGMMGVGVYPSVIEHLDSLEIGTPFDLHIGMKVIDEVHRSKAFQWFGGPGEKRDPPTGKENIREGTLIFHADKSGNLIKILRLGLRNRRLEKVIKAKVKNPQNPDKLEDVEITVPIFVQLGRIGDILNILPLVQFWSSICFNRRIPVMVHKDFMHVLSRIGYCDPIEWSGAVNDLRGATEYAKTIYNRIMQCQLFSSDGLNTPVLKNYNLDQYYACGQHDKFNVFPLEIDRRSDEDERRWLNKHRKTDKPLICYNLTGFSSPFKHVKEVKEMLQNRFTDCEIMDLSESKCTNYTDQIAALDACSALLTIDTCSLHLAQGSHVQYVGLVSEEHNGWGATVPRRVPAFSFRYSEAPNKLAEIESVLRGCIERSSKTFSNVYHIVPRRTTTEPRILSAVQSWEWMYANGLMSPLHVWFTERDAKVAIGDRRSLPFLKDILKSGLDVADDNSICVFTNDDIILTESVIKQIRSKLRFVPMVTGSRIDIEKYSDQIKLNTVEYDGDRHLGRDMFAYRTSWMRQNIDSIPDFIIGASDWDIVIAAMARNLAGLPTTDSNIGMVFSDCETRFGSIIHQKHDAFWSRRDNERTAKSQIHNRTLAEEWFRFNNPDLRFWWFNRT